MRFQLIRHGQTPSNVAGQLDTAYPGASLTPLGHRQARALPQAFSGGQLQSIYASTLNRTQLTARPLSESAGQKLQVIDGLEEISAGTLEMQADEASRYAYGMCLHSWMHGNWEQKMPGGPNGYDFIELQGLGNHRPGTGLLRHGRGIQPWCRHSRLQRMGYEDGACRCRRAAYREYRWLLAGIGHRRNVGLGTVESRTAWWRLCSRCSHRGRDGWRGRYPLSTPLHRGSRVAPTQHLFFR